VIRRATSDDADFLLGLVTHDEVAPYLSAVRPNTREAMLERIERSQREPSAFGIFVIEVDGGQAGTLEFEEWNRRSRIAHCGGLAVHPEFRGRRLADEAAVEFQRHLLLDLGFHRLQMEIYAFNERSIAHAERAGWVREGEKRRAYRRHGGWVGSFTYSLLREDLGLPADVDALYEYVARFNRQDWDAVGECFAEDGVLEFEHIPIGPFEGREEVVAAYAAQPPDDEVRILEATDGEPVVASYAWSVDPAVAAGELRARFADGLIARLTVT
jgi:RimJ/RimL family protein N-acetyltransferase